MEKTHRVSKLIGVVLAVAALVLMLLWMQGLLGGHKIEPGEVSLEKKGLQGPYETGEAKKATYVNREESVGTVRTKRDVMIVPRIMGTLLELPVKSGDPVEQGQVLARLDDRDVLSRLEQARSAAAEAESEFARASSDYERFDRLHRQQAVTDQKFEHVKAAYRSADARLKRAREAVKEAQVNVGYTVIRSPVTGYVVEKHMQAGAMAEPGRPIMEVQEGGTLRLEAGVREGLAGRVELGDRFPVRIDALDTELVGVVDEKIPVADPRSRSFLVKLSLPHQEGLRSGMFGRLYIPTGTVNPLTIPRDAVRTVGQLQSVWVVSGPAPQKRYVRTGRVYGDRVEVLSGLEEGDKVAVFKDKD